MMHIEEGFNFLVQNARKYGGKMLIKPAKKNLKNFLSKVRRLIKGNPSLPVWKLINLLNPVIRRWATYHRHVVAKDIFNYVDTHILRVIRQWCKRRHKRKSRHWVADKYFTFGDKRWKFSAATPEGKILHIPMRWIHPSSAISRSWATRHFTRPAWKSTSSVVRI